MSQQRSNNPLTGARYLLEGMKLVARPRLRRFVIIPALVNVVLFGGAIYFVAGWVFEWSRGLLPEWLDWLAFVLVPIAVALSLTAMFFTFTMIANLIASPFNGALAEAIESRLTGQALPPSSLSKMVKDVGVSIVSELRKLAYIVVRIVPLALLLFIPGIGPLLWAAFSAWMLAISFVDYPMGNHGLTFEQQRKLLGQRRGLALGFGAAVMVAMTIPILNFILMPCAVAGATVMWVEQFADEAAHRQLDHAETTAS